MIISYKKFIAKMLERQEKQLADRYKVQKEKIFKLYSGSKNINELLSFTAQNRYVPHPEEGCLFAIDICKDKFKSKNIENMYLTKTGSALIKYIIKCGDYSCNNIDSFFMCYDEYNKAIQLMKESTTPSISNSYLNRAKILKLTCNNFFSNFMRIQESLIKFNISKHIAPAISDYLISVGPENVDKEFKEILKELKTLGYYDKIDEILLAVNTKRVSNPIVIFGLNDDKSITGD